MKMKLQTDALRRARRRLYRASQSAHFGTAASTIKNEKCLAMERKGNRSVDGNQVMGTPELLFRHFLRDLF